MKKVTLATTLLTLTTAFAGSAFADPGHQSRGNYHGHGHHAAHTQNLIRVHIPIRDHGPETLKLRRLIRHERNVNLDHYRLKAVVVKNGPFSNGYASLRVGDKRTGRFFLPGRERIRIPAPGRAGDPWRLRLGPGTQVRAVTAVLEPRPHRWAHGASHYRQGHRDLRRDRRYDGSDPWVAIGWLLSQDDHKRSKKQKRRLKATRAELARTEAELARTRAKLERNRERNKRLKHSKDHLEEEVARRGERDARKREQRKSRDRSDRKARGDRYVDSQPGYTQRHQQNRRS